MSRCKGCRYCDTAEYNRGRWYCDNPDINVLSIPEDVERLKEIFL